MSEGTGKTSYCAPPATSHPSKRLVADDGLSEGVSFTFFDHIEIGRYKKGRDTPGLLLVSDPTVSSRHCVITQNPDGRCFVRDTSRNGTRLNGRRLSEPTDGTVGVSNPVPVTVLVGDIRNYTGLVQHVASSEVQESVGRVFEQLERAVAQLGGTLKEFQGDAIFAFWEAGSTENHAVDACRAALALDRLVEEMADDRSIWQVEGY
ncbi:MAG: adenylate/guanylate cyclase domain-containing protein, partial [Acidobacteria bacterium]|nr:adenylate/guanylate cyclase domain-containing protein [Candidatus Sulfomarinibacter kjeldsenii]